MTTEVFPPTIIPSISDLGIVFNSKIFISPLSGYAQTASRNGARWILSMSFLNLQEATRAELKGFLAFLNGQVNRAEIKDHSYTGARGNLGGTPLVDAGNQTGNTINIKGATSSVTDWMKRGDLFHYSNGTNKELKMCTADVNSDGAGLVAVSCTPEIHTSPADNASIVTTDPVGTFMLVNPSIKWTNRPSQFGGVASPLSNFNVEWVEDIE